MNLKRELPNIIIVLIPFIYLVYIYNGLPETIPTHWNYKGEIDDWGKKSTIIMIPFLLPLLTYVLFLIIPLIDPKKKLQFMGNKYQSLKFVFTLLMSALAIFVLYSIKEQSPGNPNLIILGVGLLFTALGNYMKTIKANYFIGIRTPWTLENETVWDITHKLAGKLWFFGGLAIVLGSLALDPKTNTILCITVTAIIVLIPFIFSYVEYKKLERQGSINSNQ